jgi:hypothetical protein
MTDSLTQAAGTVRGVLDDLARLPVTASRAERSADILDRLAAELAEAAADLRKVKVAEEPACPRTGRAPRRPPG